MVVLVSPNGAVANVNDEAVERLLNAGWQRAAEGKTAKKTTTRRRAAKAK